MKIYCVITTSHNILYEKFFLPSIERSGFKVVPLVLEQSGAGEFLADDFKAAIAYKVQQIIASIHQNLGEVIVWSDVDIQFFGMKVEHLTRYFQDARMDLAIQRLTLKTANVCGGFYAIRCSLKTAAFFEKVLGVTLQETNGNEQDALNNLLHQEPPPIRWCLLGSEFYARTHGFRIPRNAVLHHATCLVPSNYILQKTCMLTALENYQNWGEMRRLRYFFGEVFAAFQRQFRF